MYVKYSLLEFELFFKNWNQHTWCGIIVCGVYMCEYDVCGRFMCWTRVYMQKPEDSIECSQPITLSSSFETGHIPEPRTKLADGEHQGLVYPCRPHHQGCGHACGHTWTLSVLQHLNSGPHVCTASTLTLWSISPVLKIGFKYNLSTTWK